jgi:uncharacterized membrane protein
VTGRAQCGRPARRDRLARKDSIGPARPAAEGGVVSGLSHSLREAGRSIRSRLVSGLVVIAPALVTIWVVRFLFHFLDEWLRPVEERVFGRYIPGTGLLATFVLVYTVGLLAAHFLGRGIIRGTERLILRLPLIGDVYGSSKQIMDAVSNPQAMGFRKVVSFDFPRPGIRAVGFVTREITSSTGESLYLVFMPTTPNPATGFMLYLPVRLAQETGLTIDQAIKMVVSGGVVAPDSFHPDVPPASGSSVGEWKGPEAPA